MKAIQKTKSITKRITSAMLFGHGVASARRRGGRTPSISLVSSEDSSEYRASDFRINVLRQGFLSLYSYFNSNRIIRSWRSRTSTDLSDSSISSYIRSLRNIRIAGMSSSIMFGLLALAIIIPLYNVSGTEDTEAATGTAIDSSITFTSTRSTASVAFNPTSTSGTFASSTAGTSDAAFSLSTTNSQGYTLKLKSSNGTDLKTSASASATSTLSTISTSTGIEPSSFAANTWGYLPSYYNSSANTTKYYPATTSDVTLRTTSSANSTAHSYTIGIGAKADLTREAGTYTLGGNSSAMVLSYAVNPTAYEITYRDNSGDSTVANMPTTTQSGSVSATSIALAPNRTPTRTGYSLTGWCLGTVSDVGTSCSGTNIATNGTLALDRTTSNSAALYAVWTPNKYTCTKQYRLQNADGSWGSYITDTTEQVAYNSTCSYSKTITNYKGSENGTNGSAASTSATMNSTSGITVQVSLWRNTFTVTKRYRKQDTSGNYPSTYTSDGTATVRYGASYTYSRSAETGFQAASTTASNVTGNTTISLDVPRTIITCYKRYKLQDENGNYPSSYTADGSTTAYYGGSCSYSRTETNYNGNNAKSTSASNVTSTQTLSLDFPRNTYTLTVTAGSNTSNATGGGTYRWGQTVTVGVNKASNTTCISYANPTWSRTSGSGTLNATSGTSVTFTMTTSNATVTASSSASNVAQTVTLSRNTGASGITIAGTNYTGSSVSLNCGTYNISGNYSSGYEFSSWSRANGVTVANTGANSTTMTVSGAGTLTLNAKQSCVAISGTMQTFTPTSSTCESGTLTDSRDNTSYKVAKLADGKWWMLDNLRLGSTSTISLSSSNTNLPSGVTWTLPASGTVCFSSSSCTGTDGTTTGTGKTVPAINTTSKDTVASTKYGSGSGKIGVYYNYCAASAGSICTDDNYNDGSADRDICPKGWRMPTGGSSGEYQALYTAYSSDASSFRTALSTPLSGYFFDGSAREQGSYGSFRSSTRSSVSYMYQLGVSSSNVNPKGSLNRYSGYSVRCVLK